MVKARLESLAIEKSICLAADRVHVSLGFRLHPHATTRGGGGGEEDLQKTHDDDDHAVVVTLFHRNKPDMTVSTRGRVGGGESVRRQK